MPARRATRIAFGLFVFVALLLIGANYHRNQLTRRLFEAIDEANVAKVRTLIAQGADVNGPLPIPSSPHNNNIPAEPPLEHAFRYDQEIALLLLQKGAKLGTSANRYLSIACSSGDIPLVKELLARGVDPNRRPTNETPLRYPEIGSAIEETIKYMQLKGYAYFTGSNNANKQAQATGRQIIALLREHGARFTLWDMASLGDVNGLKAALDAGTPIDAIGTDPGTHTRTTALSIATSVGEQDAVRLLLDRGANPNWWMQMKPGQELRDVSPLYLAVRENRVTIARLLLTHGALVQPFEARCDFSLLATAIKYAPDLVLDLLVAHARIDSSFDSPLSAAILAHRPDLVRDLLHRGVKLRTDSVTQDWAGSSRSSSDNTPTMVGASIPGRPFTSTSQSLPNHDLASEAQAHRPSASHKYARRIDDPYRSHLRLAVIYAPECLAPLIEGRTFSRQELAPLLLDALRYSHSELIPRLIALGSNVQAADGDGTTILMWAVRSAPAYVEVLLTRGADPNPINRFQMTALSLAAQAGNIEMVRLLLAHGAQANPPSSRAHTPLHYARIHHHVEIVSLLEGAGGTDK